MWKVGINAHLLSGQPGYRQAGIHVYIKQLLNHLPTMDDIAPVVFTQSGAERHLDGGLSVQTSRLPTENPMVRIAWEQSAWPLAAQVQRLDLLHSMAFVTPLASRKPKVVTVYDLSFVHFPERYTTFKRKYLQTQTARSVNEAKRVVTIAEDGKRDVHEVFGVPLDRIDVVTPGVGDIFQPIPTPELIPFKQKHNLHKPFILHVGTLQPRKNLPVLLEAFAALDDSEVELVLIGGKGWLFDEIFGRIESLGITDRVRFPGFVPDEELPFWYNAAAVKVMPSIYEGFGIPLADAMACGTPVIASTASSLPEVVGDAGLLFSPQDSTALTACIEKVVYDSSRAATMRERGFEQSRKFSWKQSGARMAAIYRKALQKA